MGDGGHLPSVDFEDLYRTTYPRVLAYARSMASLEDADDAVAEAYAIAWRRQHDIPRGAELGWLIGVTRRVLANARRSGRRAGALHALLDLQPKAAGLDPADRIARRRAARRAAGALTAGSRGGRADGLVRPLQRRRRPRARHHPGGVPDALGASTPPAARRPHPRCEQGATSMGNPVIEDRLRASPARGRDRRRGRVRRRSAGAGPAPARRAAPPQRRGGSRSRWRRRA